MQWIYRFILLKSLDDAQMLLLLNVVRYVPDKHPLKGTASVAAAI